MNKMPKLLSLFKKQYPNVEFQVVTGWSGEMYRKILNRDVHISFIKGDYNWKDNKELLYEEAVSVAAPWDFDWVAIPQLPRIEYITDDKVRPTIHNSCYSNYIQPPDVSIQVQQVEACREIIKNGLAYSILTDLVVKPYSDLITKPLKNSKLEILTRQKSMYFHNDS